MSCRTKDQLSDFRADFLPHVSGTCAMSHARPSQPCLARNRSTLTDVVSFSSAPTYPPPSAERYQFELFHLGMRKVHFQSSWRRDSYWWCPGRSNSNLNPAKMIQLCQSIPWETRGRESAFLLVFTISLRTLSAALFARITVTKYHRLEA